jgi:hypothetical protein
MRLDRGFVISGVSFDVSQVKILNRKGRKADRKVRKDSAAVPVLECLCVLSE